jgi:hypothetical protein
MTETEWLACDEPGELEHFLNGLNASARKFRLLVCACCRHIWHLLTFPGSRELVELGEKYADGFVTRERLEAASDQLESVLAPLWKNNKERSDLWPSLAATWVAYFDGRRNHGNSEGAGYMLRDVPEAVICAEKPIAGQDGGTDRIRQREERVLVALIRDIFGNPFRPAALDPAWRTPTVVALARQMYESRDFGAMPILADALQDAGCDSAAILDHCRGPGPHVRGCWVVDLVLGKS